MKQKYIFILLVLTGLFTLCPTKGYAQLPFLPVEDDDLPIIHLGKEDGFFSMYMYCTQDYINARTRYRKQKNDRYFMQANAVSTDKVVELLKQDFKIKPCLSEQTKNLLTNENKPRFSFMAYFDTNANIVAAAVSLYSGLGKDVLVLSDEEARCLLTYCKENFKFENAHPNFVFPENAPIETNFLRFYSFAVRVSFDE